MRFQKKLLLNYVLFLLVSVVIICVMYYHLSWQRFVSEEYSHLQALTGHMMQQLELQYSSMQEAAEYLLSDSELLNHLRILAAVPDKSPYRGEAEKEIRTKLNTYYIVKRYYRVIIYNESGDIFASYNFGKKKVVDSIPQEQEPWTYQATGIRGKTIMTPLHKDPWGVEEQQVYSLVREMLGYQAYLEVQQTKESLEKIFHIYDNNMKVMALFGEGKLLYSTGDPIICDTCRGMGLQGKNGVFEVKNPCDGRKEIVATAYSELTGVTVLLTEDKAVIVQKMSEFLWLACAALLLFVGLFIVFLDRASKNMARPVNELRKRMENMSFDNMDNPIYIENSIDELKALANAYEDVIKRLKESLLKEKSLSYLQLQAHYDLLQAQIAPHFLYNVLNVVSSRGFSLGDETICEICDSLSGMLRYSTGNCTRYATIEEECEYLEKYLYLMKLRYRHKIEHCISVEDKIKRQAIPKIVFQQIVENSMKHGFDNCKGTMRISVTGRLNQEENRWEMVFRDNGKGIDDKTARELKRRMAEMRENLWNHRTNIEMEFGGMGLLNTYARLVLFFGDQVEFSICGSDNGTEVVVTGPEGLNVLDDNKT